jgi:hypothetical protein
MTPRRCLPLPLACVALVVLAVSRPAILAAPPDAVVSVWYRGLPAGTPRIDDLVAIHGAGVSSITWPQKQTTHLVELRSLALKAGLDVIVRDPQPVAVTTASARTSAPQPEPIDLSMAATQAHAIQLPAIIWSEIAHGARVISLDPQSSTGFVRWTDDAGLRAWGRPAGAVAKDVSRLGTLIASFKPGPNVIFESAESPGVDFVFLDAGRSWAIVATNRSATKQAVQVHLPKDVSAAEWMNLLTSTVVAMVAKPDGPRWTCMLEPWQAKVLVIDKRPH